MGLSRKVFAVSIESFLSPCKIRNGFFQPWKTALRQYSNPSLEAPFHTRLSSRLETSHQQNTDGLAPIHTSLHLTAARNDLIQEMGLNSRDGVAPETISKSMISYYRSFGSCKEKKEAFLFILACDLGLDGDAIVNEAQELVNLQTHDNAQLMLAQSSTLRQSLTPFYNELFSYVARVEGGIKFLVDLRGDLLSLVKHKQTDKNGISVHHLTELSSQLKETLSQWFTPQLMDLQHITWESPCDILEKISHYEAVHRLRHWKDLKHRVGPDRRCFIFTHKAIPREPIAILHVALTSQPSCSIQELLNRSSEQKAAATDVSHAIFYSISATHRGLSGIDLGNYLIQQAANYLQKEFPHQLSNFLTLSPIPGFRKWLDANLKLYQENEKAAQISREDLKDIINVFPDASNPIESLQAALASQGWAAQRDGAVTQALEQPLTSLCAKYLVLEKCKGYAIDPVAHFHLQNGASVWRVNWLGDRSSKGLERSFGLMANYHYHLPDMSTNSDAYRIHGNVLYSDLIKSHLG